MLGVSVVAVVLIVAGLLIFGFSVESGPPDLSVTVRPATATEFVVVVANQGGTTAEDVIVLVRRGGIEREVEFRSVPKGDEEEARVPLSGSGPPTAEVASYKEP